MSKEKEMKNEKSLVPEALLRAHRKDVTYEEIVMSPMFQKILAETVNAILASHNRRSRRINMFYDPDNPFTAATDNQQIIVNAGCDMFRLNPDNTPVSAEEGAARIMGAVFHETGHILYTCFSEMEKMSNLLAQGNLLVTEIPEELQDAYDELQELLKNEKIYALQSNPVPIKQFMLGLYRQLNNCIEDGREERLLLEYDARFSGFYAGLEKLRESHKASGATWDMSKHNIPTFANLCLLYAKYGCVGSYTGGFKAFEDAKPVINEMLEAREARTFSELNLILLLHIWPEVKKIIQEIEEKHQKTESSESGSSQQSQSGQSSGQSGSGSGSPESGESGAGSEQSGASSEGPMSGAQNEQGRNEAQEEIEKVLSDILEAIQENLPQEESHTEDPAAEVPESKGSASGNGEANIEQAVKQIRDQLADKKARDAAEDAANESLAVAIGRGYTEYSGTQIIKTEPARHPERVLDEVNRMAGPTIRKAVADMKRWLERDMRTGTSKRKISGRKFHAEKLVYRDFLYFEDKKTKKDLPKVRVGLVVDESGSMLHDSKYRYARAAAITLYRLCKDIPNLDVAIYGHSTSGHVQIFPYTDFGLKQKDVEERLCNITHRGGNYDAIPITAMGENLLAQNAEKRMMFIITDGLPYSAITTKTAEQELTDIANKFSRKGIEIIVASIGDDEERLRSIYRNQKFLNISDPSELPGRVVRIIKKSV